MKKNVFPRILVISPVKFNQQTGSGVTMGNLFRNWPLDSIAQIHTENWTEADTGVCQQYFYLPYEKIRQSSVISMARESLRQMIKFLYHQQQTLFGHYAHRNTLLAWCKKFSPDLIYARPLDRPSFSIWLPRWLSYQLRIPYVIRILDDWPTRVDYEPVLIRRIFWRFYLQYVFKDLLQNAAVNVGISEEMCKAFQDRYKTRFISFHNCVDFNSWQPEKLDYTTKDIFKIVYVGSIKPDKELKSLLDMKEAILKLNRQKRQVHLTIYGPEEYSQAVTRLLEILPVIKYGGFFKAKEKFNVLKDADLLVLPINFDFPSTAYLGYSFQTKVPEYMASGTTILVYGPADNPNVRYARDYQWAAVVDKQDLNLLVTTLEGLIDNPDWRKDLGQSARKLALKNHNADIVRPQFQQMLKDVADQKTTL